MPAMLPNPDFNAAQRSASLFSLRERKTLLALASRRRWFDWRNSERDWAPYDARLLAAGVDRANPAHLLAIVVVFNAAIRAT